MPESHTVPRHLSTSSRAWLRHLRETYAFSPTEWQLALLAAESRERAATARRLLAREGLTISTPIVNKRGDIVGSRTSAHPAAAIVKDSVATFSRLVGQLGLDDKGGDR